MATGYCGSCRRIQAFPLAGWHYCSAHRYLICDQCWNAEPGMACIASRPHGWSDVPCSIEEIPAGAIPCRGPADLSIADPTAIWHGGRPLVDYPGSHFHDPYLPGPKI